MSFLPSFNKKLMQLITWGVLPLMLFILSCNKNDFKDHLILNNIVFNLPDSIQQKELQIYEMKSLADFKNDTFLYAIANETQNRLYYYSNKFKLTKTISIKKKQQFETFDLIIESLDSIYSIMDKNTIELYIPSKDSSYIIKPEPSTMLFLNSFKGVICSYEFFNKNTKIAKNTYACYLPNLSLERKERYNNYWGAVLTIMPSSYSYKVSNYFLKFPDVYRREYFFVDYPNMTVAKDNIYYTFCNTPIVYNYSILEDKTTVYSLNLNGFTDIKSISYEKNPNNMDSIEESQLLSSSQFSTLTYDRYKNRFFAIHVKPSSIYNDSGLRNLINEKEFELLILDINMKTIANISFPKSTYDYYRYYVTPIGIFFRRIDSKKITYDLFEF
jgi:hypothetical protein